MCFSCVLTPSMSVDLVSLPVQPRKSLNDPILSSFRTRVRSSHMQQVCFHDGVKGQAIGPAFEADCELFDK